MVIKMTAILVMTTFRIRMIMTIMLRTSIGKTIKMVVAIANREMRIRRKAKSVVTVIKVTKITYR